jgi:regulator of sigma E protease
VLSSLIGFLIAISIIVFVHEMGHYLAARSIGVKILEFSIGFGKSLFTFKDKHGTKWKISSIPLGGYVKMFGDTGPSSSKAIKKLSKLPKEIQNQSLAMQAPIKRMYIAFAGPFANYLLSFLIFSSFFFFNGEIFVSNQISNVLENSPAYYAGLKAGDRIISVNNRKTASFEKIYNYISINPNMEIDLEIDRSGSIFKSRLKTEAKEIKDKKGNVLGRVGSIGVYSSEPESRNLDIISSTAKSFDYLVTMSLMTFESITQMITGARPLTELRGTITIADHSGKNLEKGFVQFALFIAMISVNMGFINLMPIPVLDGGHIIFCFYEILVGRPPSARMKAILNGFGMLVIIFMFVISTSNDIKALLF